MRSMLNKVRENRPHPVSTFEVRGVEGMRKAVRRMCVEEGKNWGK